MTRALAERDRHMEEKMESERKALIQKAVADAVMEKDRQLEQLMARQQTLTTECQRHRDNMRLLSDGEHLRYYATCLVVNRTFFHRQAFVLRFLCVSEYGPWH